MFQAALLLKQHLILKLFFILRHLQGKTTFSFCSCILPDSEVLRTVGFERVLRFFRLIVRYKAFVAEHVHDGDFASFLARLLRVMRKGEGAGAGAAAGYAFTTSTDYSPQIIQLIKLWSRYSILHLLTGNSFSSSEVGFRDSEGRGKSAAKGSSTPAARFKYSQRSQSSSS